MPVKLFLNGSVIYDHAEIWPGSSEVLHNVPHRSARVLWVGRQRVLPRSIQPGGRCLR